MEEKAINKAAEVAKIIRNRGSLRNMEFNAILNVVKIVLRAYDDHNKYEEPHIKKDELDGYIIDQLMINDNVFGVTHDLLRKINFYSTEYTLKKSGLIPGKEE